MLQQSNLNFDFMHMNELAIMMTVICGDHAMQMSVF